MCGLVRRSWAKRNATRPESTSHARSPLYRCSRRLGLWDPNAMSMAPISRSPLTPLRTPLPRALRPVACRSPWSHARSSHEATRSPHTPRATASCHAAPCTKAMDHRTATARPSHAHVPCPSALAFFLQRGTVALVVRGAVPHGRLPGPSQAMAGSTPSDTAAPGSARGLHRSVWRLRCPRCGPSLCRG